MVHSRDALIPGSDEASALHPARRMRLVDEIDHVHSFSVNAGVTDEQAWAEFRRFHRRIAFGHSRRCVSIDGAPSRRYRVTADGFVPIHDPVIWRKRIVWASRVARSYIVMWATIAWRYTVGRRRAEARLAMLERSILRAIQHGYEAAGEVSPNLKAKAQGEGGHG